MPPIRSILGSVLLATTALAMPVLAKGIDPSALDLHCRRTDGPWRPCRMGIETPGRQWWIELAGDRIQFHHDGSGIVTVQRQDGGAAINVRARWDRSGVLCWGPICARGALPLD